MYRSNHTQVVCKKVVGKIFTTFTGKRLFRSLFYNKVAGLRKVFSRQFRDLLRTSFLQKIYGDYFYIYMLNSRLLQTKYIFDRTVHFYKLVFRQSDTLQQKQLLQAAIF